MTMASSDCAPVLELVSLAGALVDSGGFVEGACARVNCENTSGKVATTVNAIADFRNMSLSRVDIDMIVLTISVASQRLSGWNPYRCEAKFLSTTLTQPEFH